RQHGYGRPRSDRALARTSLRAGTTTAAMGLGAGGRNAAGHAGGPGELHLPRADHARMAATAAGLPAGVRASGLRDAAAARARAPRRGRHAARSGAWQRSPL